MAQDLLLEIGTEEIPAKFMPGALKQLGDIAADKLREKRIAFSGVETFGTPRRLTLAVRQVEERQSDKNSENKGPSVKIAFDENGAPTKAAQGFARGQGVDVKDLVVKDGYVFAVVQETGQAVETILPELLPEIISSIAFPKSMRWGTLDVRFARPVRWLVALFGSQIVPFVFAEITSGSSSSGHRFLSSGPVTVQSVNDYLVKMTDNHVIVDQGLRRQIIREQIEKLAVQHGGTASIDEDLLEEVVFLVEYPTALCGSFDAKYLALPKEALVTPMREHQRYFPVFDKAGSLLPLFITVRNGGSDYIDIVRHGNERVLKARLADAEFFYEEDKKVSLSDRVEKLKTIVYQEGLGSLYDKTLRLEKLAAVIAAAAGAGQAVTKLARAAHLAKADLVTGMVCEFTELQGVMGREYALIGGEEPEVAEAVFEHYLPRFAGDILPQTSAGKILSIADKLDNIVATFSRGLIPTGSQDPFALRRQALGIVNILINSRYHISLAQLAETALDLLNITDQARRGDLLNELQDFFKLRLKNVLTDDGMRYDMIDAVLAAGMDDIYDAWLRAKALSTEGLTDSMHMAVQALTRAGNLAKNAQSDNIDPALFETEAEKTLHQAYLSAEREITAMTEAGDYQAVFKVLAGLAAPIDAFFGQVMVMAENLSVRNNRLALLKAITNIASKIADLSKIVTG